jgi:serine/threonine-protein kinase
VHDAGVSDQGAYIAMELLKGRDLRLLRQEGWRPTPMQAALIVRRVADALSYAHSKGVIHLDIKPANIFMVGRTQPKVLDFGIARIAHRHDTVANEGLVAGSPHYMAPEQVREQPVDRRADVFSLGVVLYELLTDQKPFVGQTLSDITRAVLEVDPPLASQVDPNVPRPLAEIAQRALHKDPEARYRSARSFARDLRHWLDEHAQATEPAEEPAPKAAAPSMRTGLLGWAAAAGLALALSTVLWTTLGRDRGDAEAARAEPPQGAVAGGLVAPAPARPAAGATPPAAATAATGPSPTVGTRVTTSPPVVPPGTVAPSPGTSPANVAAGSAGAAVTAGLSAPVTSAASPAPGTPAPPSTTAGASTLAPPAAGPGSTRQTAAASPAREPRAAPAERARPPREAGRSGNTATASPAAGAAAAVGEVRIAVTPWGEVEVDGTARGTTPPLSVLRLPEGRHQIVIRNADFPPYATTVVVRPGEPVTVRHRFGS